MTMIGANVFQKNKNKNCDWCFNTSPTKYIWLFYIRGYFVVQIFTHTIFLSCKVLDICDKHC